MSNDAIVQGLQKGQQALTEIRAHKEHCDERNQAIHREIRDRDLARVRDISEIREDISDIAQSIRADLGDMKSRQFRFLVYLVGVLLAIIGALVMNGALDNLGGKKNVQTSVVTPALSSKQKPPS